MLPWKTFVNVIGPVNTLVEEEDVLTSKLPISRVTNSRVGKY